MPPRNEPGGHEQPAPAAAPPSAPSSPLRRSISLRRGDHLSQPLCGRAGGGTPRASTPARTINATPPAATRRTPPAGCRRAPGGAEQGDVLVLRTRRFNQSECGHASSDYPEHPPSRSQHGAPPLRRASVLPGPTPLSSFSTGPVPCKRSVPRQPRARTTEESHLRSQPGRPAGLLNGGPDGRPHTKVASCSRGRRGVGMKTAPPRPRRGSVRRRGSTSPAFKSACTPTPSGIAATMDPTSRALVNTVTSQYER